MKKYKMKQTKSKIGIIVCMLLIVGGMLTCQFSESTGNRESSQADGPVLTAWKKEKAQLILSYEIRLNRLSRKQDSLTLVITDKKKLLIVARANMHLAQMKIQRILTETDTGMVQVDSIKPLVDSLVAMVSNADTACTALICTLESQIAAKDSSMTHLVSEVSALKQINDQNELHIHDLKLTIESGAKAQRRAERTNKLLSAGMLLLAGLGSALLIVQSVR